MNLKLNYEKLVKILSDFYLLSHVRIVVYDRDFNRIAAYPEQSSDFCKLLKQNPSAKKMCRINEAEACKKCDQNNSLYIYQCHAGLTEAVAPIKMNDMVLGYIMFGQLLRTRSDENRILNYAKKYIGDMQVCKKAFNDLKVRNDEQVKAISNIMQACTSYLWMSEIIKPENNSSIYLLTNYINSNLGGDLSVDTLCSVLKVSRVNLYGISKEYYGMSIAKYIRQKRVSKAAQMLVEDNCSVREAAISVGFCDYNYFSKVFKREMGMKPTEYKKIYKKKNDSTARA